MEPPLMTAATNRPSSPFETARLALIKRLLEMKAPRSFVAFPHPTDFEVVADHIREAAAIFDEWLAAIGAEVRDNTNCHVSTDLFAGSFSAAIDGNETWACEESALSLQGMRRAG
jgi:hypothetical protein